MRTSVEDYKQNEHLKVIAQYLRPQLAVQFQREDICDWAEKNYYIQDDDLGYSVPIRLLPHQKTILRFMFSFVINWQTMIYSTVKKSGKTAIAGLVARYVGEQWGPRNEILCMANDLEQARGRIYKAAQDSIELDPNFDRGKHILPGRWHSVSNQLTSIANGTTIRAVSTDYRGEAGSNPTVTLWSELWGYTSESSRRLWSELTPVPTRKRSFRFIETYAGYEDESDILLEEYEANVKKGRRVTREELAPYGEWPFEDDPPIYVNEDARTVAYWDTGEIARRMPWQTDEYYRAQKADPSLTEQQFERLHLNHWTSSVSEFLPIEWWERLARGGVDLEAMRNLNPREPLVLAADASVNNDCTALVGVTRHHDPARRDKDVIQRYVRIWTPTHENPMDYTHTIEADIRRLCSQFNVVELAYDPYQLHKMATDLRNEAVVWARPFQQGQDREKADFQLFTMIRDMEIEHTGDPEMKQHVKNAGKKQNLHEDTKLRIVKKPKGGPIDATVATSMAVAECKRLML